MRKDQLGSLVMSLGIFWTNVDSDRGMLLKKSGSREKNDMQISSPIKNRVTNK
jgi:hypothetical protein